MGIIESRSLSVGAVQNAGESDQQPTQSGVEQNILLGKHDAPSTRDTLTKQHHPPAYQLIDPNTELYLLNGLSTKTAYRRLQTQVEQAQKVEVFSPYITYPMLDSVAKVRQHTVWMPKYNNKALVKLTSRLPRYRKLNIQLIPGSPEEMLHAKVIILDDETLIYGSSNFDLISYLFEQELVIVRRNAGLVQEIQNALRP